MNIVGNMKQISVKDMKENPELKWALDMTKGSMTIDRFLKKYFIVGGDEVKYRGVTDPGDGTVSIVDSCHVMIVSRVPLDNIEVDESLKLPVVSLDQKVELTGCASEDIVVLSGDGFENYYNYRYFVDAVKVFGEVKSMNTREDYPVRIEFVSGVVVLIAPRIGGELDDDIYRVKDVDAWLPEMFGKKKCSANEKISYLYKMDPDMKLGDALERMEGLLVKDGRKKKINRKVYY